MSVNGDTTISTEENRTVSYLQQIPENVYFHPLYCFRAEPNIDLQQQFCLNKDLRMPFSVLVGLALLNAKGRPIPTTAIYDFVNEYFPDFPTYAANTWKSSVRNTLCKYDFFGKVRQNGYPGRPKALDWVLVKPKLGSFQRLFNKFEAKNPDPSTYGMRDVADWPQIKEGTKGLPKGKTMEEGNATSKVPIAKILDEEIVSPPVLSLPAAFIQEDLLPKPASGSSSRVQLSSASTPPFSMERLADEDNISSSPKPQETSSSAPSQQAPLLIPSMYPYTPMAMPYFFPPVFSPSFDAYHSYLKQHLEYMEKIYRAKTTS